MRVAKLEVRQILHEVGDEPQKIGLIYSDYSKVCSPW